MMNLTRMKSFSGEWINTCVKVANEYKDYILYGDQDIANIIFNEV